MMYKCYDYNIEKIDCCKKIINSADKMIFTKAKKILNKKEFLRFNLAYYFPIIYKLFYKIYFALKQLLPQKDIIDGYKTQII